MGKKGILSDFEGCTLVMGSPGTGKTTTAARIVYECKKMNIPVWSNVHIKGAMKVEISDLMEYEMIGGYVIFDEAGIDFNNRGWKAFTKKQIEFFKLHRHYELNIVILSQNKDDSDVTIRRLATMVYLLKYPLLWPWFVKYVKYKIVTEENETHDDIITHYYKEHWLKGGIRYLYKKRCIYKLFNSYERKPLKKKVWEVWGEESKNTVESDAVGAPDMSGGSAELNGIG